jgi:hypothetical protein
MGVPTSGTGALSGSPDKDKSVSIDGVHFYGRMHDLEIGSAPPAVGEQQQPARQQRQVARNTMSDYQHASPLPHQGSPNAAAAAFAGTGRKK